MRNSNIHFSKMMKETLDFKIKFIIVPDLDKSEIQN